MTEISATVEVSLRGLTRFRAAMKKPSGFVLAALKQWGHRYRTFIRRRFVEYSNGGGDWAPLAPATIAARKNKKKSSIQILRDTNTMFNALEPTFVGAPGQLEDINGWGVEVGFGGQGRYPNGIAISDVASFHQEGGVTLPQRKIIVPPDQDTRTAMANDMEKALLKEAKASGM